MINTYSKNIICGGLLVFFCIGCAISAPLKLPVTHVEHAATQYDDGLSVYLRILEQVKNINAEAFVIAIKGQWIDVNLAGEWSYTFQVGAELWTYTSTELVLKQPAPNVLTGYAVPTEALFRELYYKMQQQNIRDHNLSFQVEWVHAVGWEIKKVN